jgi:hypothetical protein
LHIAWALAFLSVVIKTRKTPVKSPGNRIMIQKAAAVKMSAKAILFYDTNFSIRRAIALRPSKDFYVASKPTQQKLPRRQLTKKKNAFPLGELNFFRTS